MLRKELALNAAELNYLILRSVVDHAIITLDLEGRVTSWNEGAGKILGWTEDEIIGQSADVFFTPEDVAQNRREIEMARALEHGRADDERWHCKKDGQRFWASGLMMPLRSESQADAAQEGTSEDAKGFVKIFRDRTFYHEASQRIARLESRASIAMRRSGTVGVFELDTGDSLVVSDKIAASMHGIAQEDAANGVPIEVFLNGIHPDDVSKVSAAMREAIATGSDLDQVYRSAKAAPRIRWLHSQAAVQIDTNGRAARLSGIVVDTTKHHERMRMQEAQLNFIDTVRDCETIAEIAAFAARTIGETLDVSRAGHGYVEADGDTVNVRDDWAADGFESLKGLHRLSSFGRFSDALHRGEVVVVEDVNDQEEVADPSAFIRIGSGAFVNLPLMEKGHLKALLFVHDAEPRDWSGDEIRFMQAILDRAYAATDRLSYEIERDLMSTEMAHRMKNMLSIAHVIVSQSLRNVSDLGAARDAIGARLRALGDAQNVLTKVEHKNAPIAEVVKSALVAHADASQLTVSGDAFDLSPQQVLGLSLALHELGTNAVKYGALSSKDGHVSIRWTNTQGCFHLEWRETGGPEVSKPSASGFGSTILTRVVGGYFSGTTKLEFEPKGLVYQISGSL